MPDLSTFNPGSVSELLDTMIGEVSQVAGDWWEENSGLMKGYLAELAEGTMQTGAALAEGRISAETADAVLRGRARVLDQLLDLAAYMTLVLAQKLADAIFRVVGWAIYNRTGVNLAPHLSVGSE
ncbi:MAG: hypothetical protein ACTS1Z_01645 [Parasphingopyxis sp.]|uniref:hypothetical protein n=1 Tax=Parasphingopyxis sp. TaxID=1920299 RepID=UPI003F9FE265